MANYSDYIRSAAEAVYGGPESVCGQDERTIQNPLAPYYEAIAFLAIDAADGTQWRGTGFFINYGNQAAVLTAGHCVYMKNNGGFAKNIGIVLGKDGNSQPKGVINVGTSGLRAPDQWKNSTDQNYDWGLIIVGGQRWGLGVQVQPDNVLNGMPIITAGYPADKPGYQMWGDNGPVSSVSTNKVYYMDDTYGGQSGSPVWGPVPGQSYSNVVGIHAYGGCPNSATRVTNEMLNLINTWTS